MLYTFERGTPEILLTSYPVRLPFLIGWYTLLFPSLKNHIFHDLNNRFH